MTIRRLFQTLLWFTVCASPARAHVVNQLYAEWREADGLWKMEVQFEAGYAEPSIRNDPEAPAPERDWLLSLGESGWKPLRAEAERYLREALEIQSGGKQVKWDAEFIDFNQSPPDFPKLLTNGAYMRMVVTPTESPDGPVQLHWRTGEIRPTFTLKVATAEGGYLVFEPGERKEIGVSSASGALWTSFRQGFLHVVPKGWDHVLFVLGLFFYRRKWRPLLAQSLAFTAAHTVTLGLAASGVVTVSGNWVEPVIALSLVAVALENLRAERESKPWLRLGIVFAFGLIHGLGFAGALSAWLRPGDGFLPSLFSANLGVEAAQAAILGAAWVATLRWHRAPAYRVVKIAACLGIAATGSWWAIERIFS